MIDPGHVSDLRWDRWLAGDLSPEDAGAALAHAEACPACGARMRELAAGRDAFAQRPIALSFAAPRVRRARRWAIGGAVATAAVVMVALRFAAPGQPAEPIEPAEPVERGEPLRAGGVERGKGGGPDLVLAVGRGGAVLRVSTGDAVWPGDALQAGYTAERDGFGAVLALDGAGAAAVYVPAGGDRMVALPAGVERSFPASTVLDRVVGAEHVVILWCPDAHAIAPLLDELRARRRVTAPAGCRARAVVLDKRGAP